MTGLIRVLVALALCTPALAHDLGVARVRVEEVEPGRYYVEARSAAGVELAAPVFPTRFQACEPPTLRPLERSWIHGWVFRTKGLGLGAGDVLVFPWDREGAFVRIVTSQGLEAGHYFESGGERLRVPMETLLGSDRSLAETLQHYWVLGVEHILFGWDHLAFVLCLCLIASGWRLARLVTAFTLGHSLTLAAAVLGIARVPIAPVEACIALSIAFVAREALVNGRRSRHGSGLVAAFGLLHGLGFASALGESGIEASEVLPGLIAFNLGVEIGQLAFVLVALAAAAVALRTLPPIARTTPALARALGVLAVFWTLERTLGLIGLSA